MKRDRFLQLAFNHTFEEFRKVVSFIPLQESIIIEAGTPLLKREGVGVISRMKSLWHGKICADIKIVDGAKQEVLMVKEAGGDLITAVGNASPETLRIFIETCRQVKITSVVDAINTPDPLKALWRANITPDLVLIHRGRDEEGSFGKVIQYKNIAKLKGKYDVMVGAAGGIDEREIQKAFFNGADLVVVNVVRPSDPWKGLVIDENFPNKLQQFLSIL